MESIRVVDKNGTGYDLVTQDKDTNDCWANCVTMAENQAVHCLVDPVGRAKEIIKKYKSLTSQGAMNFTNIVKACMGEGFRVEPKDEAMNFLSVRLQFLNSMKPAIVALMSSTDAGIVGHVVVCVGFAQKAYLLLDPLATALVELPEAEFPKYNASYGRMWHFVGQTITFRSPWK